MFSRSSPALIALTTSGLTTLPSALRGRASTTITSRGTLYATIRSFAHARSGSAAHAAAPPGAGTTTAMTRSPHVSSGTPTTATSAMAAFSRNASSISSAESLYPPLFRISTLVRPSKRTCPSGDSSATSPVRNQPPGAKAARVASSRPR
jgi:hypothetical protein